MENSLPTIPGLGLPEQEAYNFQLIVRITSRHMKPAHLQFTDTKERVNWTEKVTILGCPNEKQAKLAAVAQLAQSWTTKQYDLEVEECKKIG